VSTLDDIAASARSQADAYGQTQYTQGKADQSLTDAAALATAAQQLEAADLEVTDLNAEVVDLKAQVAALTPTPPPVDPPPPVETLRVGVYSSGNKPMTAIAGTKLTAASFYVAHGATLPAAVEAAAKAGQDIVIEISSQKSGGYDTWAAFAKGAFDADLARHRDALAALATKYGVEVFASFENEPDEKVSNNQAATGQTAAQYVAAANHWGDLCKGAKVVPLVWLAGNKATATDFLPDIAKIRAVSWDPYKTGTKTTMDASALFKAFAAKLDAKGWTADKARRLISETGIKVDAFSGGGSYTVADQTKFWAQIPAAAKAAGVELVIWFRANSGAHDYIPTDASIDPAFAAMAASVTG
jgi:hypothetical protein